MPFIIENSYSSLAENICETAMLAPGIWSRRDSESWSQWQRGSWIITYLTMPIQILDNSVKPDVSSLWLLMVLYPS